LSILADVLLNHYLIIDLVIRKKRIQTGAAGHPVCKIYTFPIISGHPDAIKNITCDIGVSFFLHFCCSLTPLLTRILPYAFLCFLMLSCVFLCFLCFLMFLVLSYVFLCFLCFLMFPELSCVNLAFH